MENVFQKIIEKPLCSDIIQWHYDYECPAMYSSLCKKFKNLSRFWLSCFGTYYWFESNSWINFHIVLNKTVLFRTLFDWSWAGGPVIIVRTTFYTLWFYYSQTRFKLFGFPIFRFWAYQMKVVLETCFGH
jgi:hypothetical protein